MQTGSGSRTQGTGSETDNVVQLPRDWFGPRDELIPIGPRSRPDSLRLRELDHRALGLDEPTAEGFWGAEPQFAFEPAAPADAAEPAVPADAVEHLAAPDRMPEPRPAPLVRRRRWAALAAALAAVVTAGAIGVAETPSTVAHRVQSLAGLQRAQVDAAVKTTHVASDVGAGRDAHSAFPRLHRSRRSGSRTNSDRHRHDTPRHAIVESAAPHTGGAPSERPQPAASDSANVTQGSHSVTDTSHSSGSAESTIASAADVVTPSPPPPNQNGSSAGGGPPPP